MKTIKYIHSIPNFTYKITDSYLGNLKIGIFDIETLGLNPETQPVILAGFMTLLPEGQFEITQYFAEFPEEEILILKHLQNAFEEVDYVLTYNGKHFDIPYIEKRAQKLGMDNYKFNLYNLDLYLVLNGYSPLRSVISNLKQKTVEMYMGLDSGRYDMISGAESIELYEAYVRCQDLCEKEFLEEKILLHNHDDLIQLFKLLPILKQVDVHKAFNGLGFPIAGENGWPTLCLTSIKVSPAGLTLSGKYPGEPFSYIAYDTFDDSFSCEFDTQNKFSFKLRTDRHKGNIFLNLNSYFDDYEELKKYPNCIDNFILASAGGSLSHLELNMFIKKFMQNFMNETVCPLMVLY